MPIMIKPLPIAMPIAAVAQMPAAVVSPCMISRRYMMMPAPKKPIPVTTCDAIRVVSALNVEPCISLKSGSEIYFDNIINKHAARQTIA